MPDTASILRRSVPFVIPGVFLGSLCPEWYPTLPLLFAAGVIALAAVWPRRLMVSVLFGSLCLVFAFALSARQEIAWNRSRPEGVVTGTASVVRVPERDDAGVKAVVRFESCDETSCPDEYVLATFSIRSDISFGDVGTLSCPLEAPDPEWRMYFAKDGIAYRCRVSRWEPTGTAYPMRRALFAVASRFEESLSDALPLPESALAAGLLLGGGRRLPDALVDDFRAAGLSHIVAVSGYNISVVASCFLLLGVALGLARPRAAGFSVVATAAFVLVSGAPASAVRAFGMAFVLVAAGWFGRRYASFRSIVFVASVMLLLNPLLLRHDVGFLLSFAATAGIAVLSPSVARLVKRTPYGMGVLVETVLLTLSANLFVLPVILANFGSFPPMSFLVNALVLPLVPYAMLASFLVGSAGAASSVVGNLLAYPAYALLRPIVFGAEAFAGFSRASAIRIPFGWTASVVWYLALVAAYHRRRLSRVVRVWDNAMKRSRS